MPYNPGVTPIGGQLIAQGINQAADSMAAGMKQYRENQLRNAALQKQNEQLAGAFLQNKDLAQYAPGGAEEIQKFLDKSIKGGGLTLKDNLALNASLNSAFLTAQHVSDLSKAKLEQERARQEIDVTNKAATQAKIDDAAGAAAAAEFGKDGKVDIARFNKTYTEHGGSAAALAKYLQPVVAAGNFQAKEDLITARQAALDAKTAAKDAEVKFVEGPNGRQFAVYNGMMMPVDIPPAKHPLIASIEKDVADGVITKDEAAEYRRALYKKAGEFSPNPALQAIQSITGGAGGDTFSAPAAPTAPVAIPEFSTTEEAAKAAASGKIKSGQKIKVGGKSGTWK